MKKATCIILLTVFSLLLANYSLWAQPYGNEWIDYSKTYLKMKVGSNAIHRIDYATLEAALSSAGESIGSINAADYQLWHNGVQVPIYIGNSITPTIAAMGLSDFIEFYGTKADGNYDAQLYNSPTHQPNPQHCLFTDSAAYFLTWSSGSNERYTLINNDLSSPPAAETFFMDQVRSNLTNTFYTGNIITLADRDINLPDFEEGEGYMGTEFNLTTSSYTVFTPYIYTSGPITYATITTGVAGRSSVVSSDFDHRLKLDVNSTNYIDIQFDGYMMNHLSFDVPIGSLSNTNTFDYKAQSLASVDKMAVAYIDVIYPRQFLHSNASKVKMKLLAGAGNKFIEMDNFNNRSTIPMLFDLTNKIKMLGNTTTGPNPLQQFNLPASTGDRILYISSQDPLDIIAITTLEVKQYTDYSDIANQGDYIIISNPRLYTDASGNNRVENYRVMRSSPIAGEYNAINVNIEELYDQFAYGIRYHNAALRLFNDFALDNFATPPTHEILLGKGVTYNLFRNNAAGREVLQIPTYGNPGGDVMVSTDAISSFIPRIAVGRVAARNADELRAYYEKVYAFEMQKFSPITPDNREWMKRVLHLTGADPPFQYSIIDFFKQYDAHLSDTISFGGYSKNFFKTSSEPITDGTSALMDSFINNGSALITFWGHSNSELWDYNIGPVTNYNNLYGRYPVILSNSCYMGKIHEIDNNSMSEEYVIAEDRGAIAYISTVGLGFSSYLHDFTKSFYSSFCTLNYGKTIGEHMMAAATLSYDTYVGTRTTTEEFTLHGDPALHLNEFEKPDYYTDNTELTINPTLVTIDRDTFDLKAVISNYGRYIQDTFRVRVVRQYPDASYDTVYYSLENTTVFKETFNFRMPTNGNIALGENKIFVKVEAGEYIDEMSEANNEAMIVLYIFANDVIPTGPCDNYFNSGDCPTIALQASTAIPILNYQNYEFQIDTVNTFDSPYLLSATINQLAGVVEWTPPLTYIDGQVYYWRVKIQDIAGSPPFAWHTQSFTFKDDGPKGWSQSDYYQFQSDDIQDILIDQYTNKFEFADNPMNIAIKTGLSSVIGFGQISLSVNFDVKANGYYGATCGGTGGVMVAAFDPIYGQPLMNVYIGPGGCSTSGIYGALNPYGRPVIWHEFITTNAGSGLREIYNMLNNYIPDGYYYCIYSLDDHKLDSTTVASHTYKDSIYSFLENQGLYGLRDINDKVPFIVWGKMNDPTYTEAEIIIGDTTTSELNVSWDIPAKWFEGSIVSTKIGPANSWIDLELDISTTDSLTWYDKCKMELLGWNNTNTPVLLNTYTYPSLPSTISLSWIDAVTYPFLQLKYYSKDSTFYTPIQLNKWTVHFEEYAELSLSQEDHLSFYNDTLMQGDTVRFKYMVRNISCTDADSVLIEVTVTNKFNVPHVLSSARHNILAGDSVLVALDFSSLPYVGLNSIAIHVNQDNKLKEKFKFNNYASLPFVVNGDLINPLIDVTFDGVHIIDGDLIKPDPVIVVKLKDENMFLALNDTALVKLFIKDPMDNVLPIYFSNPLVTFFPAITTELRSTNNEARIEYTPNFTVDGKYKLILRGYDRSGNPAGLYDYEIGFEIINKPMISNLMNYPNPFTTNTRFVFTVTGRVPPQAMKIQIFNINGKVVREITMNEINDVHIGRNITNYAWDGTDEYGSPLANGLYLYRAVAYLNGKVMDHYDSGADQFFTKSSLFSKDKSSEFGKMYLMR